MLKYKNHNNQLVKSEYLSVGEFAFNPVNGQLSNTDKSIQLEPQISALLEFFAERAGELVSKDTLYHALWPDRVVSDDAFRAVIKKLRKALGDDARAPRYIQTIPLKGYRLIADVSFDVSTSAQRSGAKAKYLALSFIVIVIGGLIALLTLKPSSEVPEFALLTDMHGSELSQSYNATLDQLVFSYRENKDDYLQLHTKSLASGITKRLTFDDANFANGHLSPDGRRLAFTRSTPSTSQTFVADFSLATGLSNLQSLPSKIGTGRYLQAWNAKGDGLYLSDLNSPESSKGIAFYHLDTQVLTSLTQPGGTGGGDVFARESHSGKYLAILRNQAPGKYELIIQHLQSGELTHIVPLQKDYTQLVWDSADEQVLLSSFYSEFARYSLHSRQLKTININASNVNDVFYHCGERCVYVRKHSGNYLDLDFQPNPFGSQQLAFFAHEQANGAESFPIFGPRSGSIYFVNKQANETQLIRAQSGDSRVLARFPIDVAVTALQVNSKESKLSGIINNRLFYIDLASSKLTYLTTELDSIVSTQWHSSANALYYARIEQNEPVLYRYEFDENMRVRAMPGYFARLDLADGKTLKIDASLNVWIGVEGQLPRLLTQIPHPSPNRWKVNNQALYYTEREENLTYLYRTDLISGETERKLLAKNRFRIQFDLSPDGHSLLGVRSVLAQSNSVKMMY